MSRFKLQTRKEYCIMKKLLTAVLSLLLLGAVSLPVLAVDVDNEPPIPAPIIAPAPSTQTDTADTVELTIQVNGQKLDAKANIMVPLRAIAEKLGFTVTWNKGVVTVTGSERYIKLTIGKDEYFAAPTQEGMMGASLFSLGSVPYVSNGSTYVPLELFDILLDNKEETITIQDGIIQISTDPAAINTTQIPNPFTDHDTLGQAIKVVGFELTIPEKVGGNSQHDIQTMGDEMIQVFYGDADNEVCVRKALGKEDISGDYTAYAQTHSVTVNGIGVTMKGENNLIYLAVWTNGGYTYSISARSGMSSTDMTALIQLVK